MACPICQKAASTCRCGTTPAQSAPAQPPARTYHKFGAYLICDACNLAVEYCACDKPPPPPPPTGDGIESTIEKRVRAWKGQP